MEIGLVTVSIISVGASMPCALDQIDLIDIGPTFPGHEQAAGVLVVSNSVENVRVDKRARFAVEAGQINPSADLPGLRSNDGNEVCLSDIRIQLVVGVL